MAQGSSSSNIKVVPHAYQALNQFKYEANELGINPEYRLATGATFHPECGSVGGHMVRRDRPGRTELLRKAPFPPEQQNTNISYSKNRSTPRVLQLYLR